MILTEDQLKQLKNVELEIFDFFIDFCKTNNLKYFISGGTLIGAVRHQGFIPWDDDIDVCMPREDYERLFQLFKENDSFQLISNENNKNCPLHWAKIIKKGTKFVSLHSPSNDEWEQGIFIDVFPINKTPASNQKFKLFFYKLAVSLLNYRGSSIKTKSITSFKHTFYSFITFCCLWWCSKKRAWGMLNNFLKKHKYIDSDLALIGPSSHFIIKDTFTDSTTLLFEGREVAAPKDYDTCLKSQYGDYMKLPPIEQRVPPHDIKEFRC